MPMKETFHDLLARTTNNHSLTSIAETPTRDRSSLKVFSWEENDGFVVNRYIFHEIDKALYQWKQINAKGCKQILIGGHAKSEDTYVAVVFDEIGALELDICKQMVDPSRLDLLKKVRLVRETHYYKFFVDIFEFVREEATYLSTLKLIVIFFSGENDVKIVDLLDNLRHRDLQILIFTTGKWPKASSWRVDQMEDGTFRVLKNRV